MDRVEQEAVSSLGYQKRVLRAIAAGQLDEAEGLYRRLVEVRPHDGEVRYNLATLLANMGKVGKQRPNTERLWRTFPTTFWRT